MRDILTIKLLCSFNQPIHVLRSDDNHLYRLDRIY